MNKESISGRFKLLNCCVVIPTFNNQRTIEKVISDILEFTSNILVLNDGCTDNTPQILKKFSQISVVSHEVNKGKGMALQTAFKAAADLGYRYAITIDSDGQHFPEDLPVFLDKIEAQPDSIIVGARNMEQSSVPGKSSFGHKFSNFWFKFETGVNLPDTQSGYRLYPVQILKDFKWITNKYEFEIEVLVRASWSGIPVISVPVKVYYAPAEERVSHFRPFKDFSRVSVLNTILVIITLLYIKPRNLFRFIQKKKIIPFIREQFLNKEEANSRKIYSIAFGVFMGIFPIWGFQLLIGIPLSHFFRLNKALFILAAHISIPPMIPLIIFFSHMIGGHILGVESHLIFENTLTLESVKNEIFQYYIGAVALSFIGAAAGGALAFILTRLVPLPDSKENVVLVKPEINE